MKGVIQLVVEVNYDEMLKAENLEGIHAYTGIQTADGMMKGHMSALGNKIVAQLEGLPYVKYNVDGQFYPSTPEQPQVEAVEEVVEQVEEQPSPDVEQEVEVETDELIKPLVEDIFAKLDNDLDTITAEHGMPKAIRVNGEFLERIKNFNGIDASPSHYRGFELRIEGMEEPYVIEFKPYDGTELRMFTREIDSQKS